jgi:hypothetical protein
MAFIVPFIPLIAAGIGAATAAVAIAEQPSMPKAAAPTMQQTSMQQAASQEAAAQAQAMALRKRRGMAATELTSPMGTSGTAAIGKATLG